MLDTEPEIPPTPSASGTAAVVSQAHGPRFVLSNFPVPQEGLNGGTSITLNTYFF